MRNMPRLALRLSAALASALLLVCGRSAAQEEPEYRVGPQDVVKITVWNHPDWSGNATVNHDGKLLIAPFGEIEAEGLTEKELGAELYNRYRILDTDISEVLVAVVEYKSRNVTIVGEVRNPGTYAFRVIPDLWEVITKAAGGPTATADLGRVQIGRREKELRTMTVDLSGALDGVFPDSLPGLLPFDTINVPTLTGETTVATGSTFQVLGAVNTPGVYGLSTAGTVVEALARAGGPIPEANLSKVQLTRTTPTGVVAYKMDLNSLLFEGKPLADFDLKEGDTLTVPTKAFGIGSVGRGILVLLPLVTSLTSLIVVLND